MITTANRNQPANLAGHHQMFGPNTPGRLRHARVGLAPPRHQPHRPTGNFGRKSQMGKCSSNRLVLGVEMEVEGWMVSTFDGEMVKW